MVRARSDTPSVSDQCAIVGDEMNVRCANCGTVNSVGARQPGTRYRCASCRAFLPSPPPKEEGGETSAAVGLLGGAALGAALGGPPGAVIGAIVGAILGKSAKGVG